jgi:CheY-like chemotaxis protein
VLVIDDDPSSLISIEKMLGEQYVVMTAGGGKAALDVLATISDSVDLIICDLSMPDINGAYFYLHLANKYPGLETKIIFMTAGPFATFLDDFGISQMNPCLAKPIDKEILHKTIEEFFRNAEKSSGGKD